MMDSSCMESCQAMAEKSLKKATILENGKMIINMDKEQMSGLKAERMWVPGKTASNMVKANTQKQTAQSSKENGWKTSSMVWTV